MRSIVVADHHALMREGLVLILRDLVDGAAPVTPVGRFNDLFAILDSQPPGTLLIDPQMPGCSGAAIFEELRRRAPGWTPVALGNRPDQPHVTEALRNGARGFVPKSSGSDVLRDALMTVWAGGIFVPPALAAGETAAKAPPAPPAGNGVNVVEGLTPRQSQVLDCIRRGCSNRDIARELGMSEGTVKNHVKALLRVLNVRNRTQAALLVL